MFNEVNFPLSAEKLVKNMGIRKAKGYLMRVALYRKGLPNKEKRIVINELNYINKHYKE